MKKILIISLSDLSRDPRVNRQIKLLSKKYNIYTLGFIASGISSVKFHQIESNKITVLYKIKGLLLLKLKNFEKYIWSQYFIPFITKVIAIEKFDLVLVNDIDILPVVLRYRDKARVLFDAHEYIPKEYEDLFFWRFFYQAYKKYLCSKYLKEADLTLTVCNRIALEYKNQFFINSDVINNATRFVDLSPTTIVNDKIRLIYHGGAVHSRRIDLMIKMAQYLEPIFELNLMLVPGDSKYIMRLKRMGQKMRNVRFINPVSMTELITFTSKFDIGLYILPPISFNNQYALPNKFFEYIQARLAVAIGPSPEMADLVLKYDCGIVSEDFSPESMARKLNGLTKEKIEYYKAQSHKAAYELSEEQNLKKLEIIVSNLLST